MRNQETAIESIWENTETGCAQPWSISKEEKVGRLLRRRRPFTLIELLVVIAIIIILVGILLAALKAVWDKNDVAQTQGLIASIETGINGYFSSRGKYPKVSMDPGTINGKTYTCATPDLYRALCTTLDGGPYCSVSDAFVNDKPEKNSFRDAQSKVMPVLIDKWDTPIFYIIAQNYSKNSQSGLNANPPLPNAGVLGGALYDNDIDKVYFKFTTYQLRSLGKNKVDDMGKKDDIQNFEMKK